MRIEPPISFEPRLGTTIGAVSSVGVAEQLLLGRAARVGERAQLPRVELRAGGGQLARDDVREREVHVVAAEQDVVADRDALQLEVALALEHGDQREVAGAAADVDDEDDVADLHLLAPAAAARLDPAVERGLRLFEQRQRPVAGGLGRLGGQLARGRVERGRDRDRDVLLGERRLGVRVVPGFAQVLEVAHRRLERRDARHFGRRVARQDRRAPVDARVAEPALRARHEADRRRRAAAAREFADRVVARRPVHGSASSPGASSSACGRYRNEGSSGERFDRARARSAAAIGSTPCTVASPSLARDVDVGQRAVRGAEIDADGE